MVDSRIFDTTYKFLGKALDISARRHNLISTNISNMDTIGYRPRDLDFQKTLARATKGPPPSELQQSHPEHFDGIDPSLKGPLNGRVVDESDIYHLDTVDIDTEMMNLSSNNGQYKKTVELMLRKMNLLKHAIAEGGK